MPGQSDKFASSVVDQSRLVMRATLWLLVVLVCAPTTKSQEPPARSAIVVAEANSQTSRNTSATAGSTLGQAQPAGPLRPEFRRLR